MVSVSSDFTAAAISTRRKPRARVKITWSDPYIDAGIGTTTSEDNRISYTDQVADLIEAIPYKWAILGQGIIADGSYHVMPGTAAEALNYQVGWIGETASGVGGAFAPPVTIEVTFPERPILTVLVVGDDQYDEYPADFTVSAYYGGTLLHTETVTGNTDRRWTADVSAAAINAADKLVLSITKWSVADRVVKITEFYSSIVATYDGDDILSMDLMEESEVGGGSIPIGNVSSNELVLALQNIENDFFSGNTASAFHTLMKRNRKIEPEIGFVLPDDSVEYVPLGTFWSGDWSEPELGVEAATTARDRMELMRKLTFDPGGVYVGYTLAALAALVLDDAQGEMPDLEYSIDAGFGAAVIPYAYFKKTNHMAALKDIVSAGLGRAYCDRDGVVRVEQFAVSSTTLNLEITRDNYFTRDLPANTEQLANRIEVTTQPLTPQDESEVYKQKEAVAIAAGATTSTIQCKFSSTPVINASAKAYVANGDGELERDEDDVITNAQMTLTSATYYPWGADVTVTNGTGVAAKYLIVIEGQELKIDGSEIITADDADSQREFGVVRYEFPDNPLVQTVDQAEDIADALLDSYKQPRKDATCEWRSNPALELSDVVDLPVFQSATIDLKGRFRVFRSKLNFDGTLSGSLQARKLFEYVDGVVYQGTNDDTDTELQGTNALTDSRLQGISAEI